MWEDVIEMKTKGISDLMNIIHDCDEDSDEQHRQINLDKYYEYLSVANSASWIYGKKKK